MWHQFLQHFPSWVADATYALPPETHWKSNELQTMYREDGREDAMYEAIRSFVVDASIAPQTAFESIVQRILLHTATIPMHYFGKTFQYLVEHEVDISTVLGDLTSSVRTEPRQFLAAYFPELMDGPS